MAKSDAAPGQEETPAVQQEVMVFKPDESIPGGRYLAADGVTLTNCWGQRIDESGNVLDETPLPRGS